MARMRRSARQSGHVRPDRPVGDRQGRVARRTRHPSGRAPGRAGTRDSAAGRARRRPAAGVRALPCRALITGRWQRSGARAPWPHRRATRPAHMARTQRQNDHTGSPSPGARTAGPFGPRLADGAGPPAVRSVAIGKARRAQTPMTSVCRMCLARPTHQTDANGVPAWWRACAARGPANRGGPALGSAGPRQLPWYAAYAAGNRWAASRLAAQRRCSAVKARTASHAACSTPSP
jgi:hypothetical protein